MCFKPQSGRVMVLSLSLCLLAAATPDRSWAQARQAEASHPAHSSTAKLAGREPTSQLLNSDEGLTVLAAALETRHRTDSRLDCSHLIHTIYERAGFPYPYASSSDLYRGVEDFRRVTYPQTGDLIVWHGHSGIVISAEQHTFFSALRSGRGVESYDAKYWKRRGEPRFFRYIKTAPSLRDSSGRGELKLTGLRSINSQQPIVAVTSAPTEAAGEEPPPSAQPASPDLSIRQAQVLSASRPKQEEVSKAVRQSCDVAAQALESRDLFNMAERVMVFDKLTVRKVHLKRDEGWAEVQIDGLMPLLAAHSASKKGSERQRWRMVRRDRDSWDLALPRQAIYVSHEIAVRVLAHQLTALTDSDPKGSRGRKVQLAELLSALLNQPVASKH